MLIIRSGIDVYRQSSPDNCAHLRGIDYRCDRCLRKRISALQTRNALPVSNRRASRGFVLNCNRLARIHGCSVCPGVSAVGTGLNFIRECLLFVNIVSHFHKSWIKVVRSAAIGKSARVVEINSFFVGLGVVLYESELPVSSAGVVVPRLVLCVIYQLFPTF